MKEAWNSQIQLYKRKRISESKASEENNKSSNDNDNAYKEENRSSEENCMENDVQVILNICDNCNENNVN